MKPTRATILIAALLSSSIPIALSADTPPWPQFRGPGGNASAVGQSIPLTFGPEKNVLWKVALPSGHSSPCIWGDRIFLTGHVGTTLKMICVQRTDGKILWERERTVSKLLTYEHVAGSPANSTPATDGQRVVFQFDDYGVVVTDLAGGLIWEQKFAPTGNAFSYGASPILDDGNLYLNRDGSLDSSLLCLDVATRPLPTPPHMTRPPFPSAAPGSKFLSDQSAKLRCQKNLGTAERIPIVLQTENPPSKPTSFH